MNNKLKTALEHAVIAVLLQLLLSPLFGLVCAGVIACSIFLGREIAQHEYKGGGANNVPLFYGLFNQWDTDSVLDVLLPIISTGVITWLFV